MPRSLEDLLSACQAQERVVGGINRRTAFRTTRIIVGALIEAGYSPVAVAHTLGISTGSIRSRIEHDGVLAAEMGSAVTGMDSQEWAAFTERHRIVPIAEHDPDSFHAIDIVRALAKPGSPDPMPDLQDRVSPG